MFLVVGRSGGQIDRDAVRLDEGPVDTLGRGSHVAAAGTAAEDWTVRSRQDREDVGAIDWCSTAQ